MSEKLRRLRELTQRSDQFPQTCWDADEFQTLRPGPATRWWVRSLVEDPAQRYRHSQGPWSPAEVDRFFVQLDHATRNSERFVVQKYIEPAIAGASLSIREFVLTEGIVGAAAPLLRNGASGDMIASQNGTVGWWLRRGALDAEGAELLERAHRSIPNGPNAMWEWIVSTSGDVFHVDYKPLDTSFLSDLPHVSAPQLWLLGPAPEPGREEIVIPDTSITHLAALRQPSNVHIGGGSPLAHLCYQAVLGGHAVVVAVDDVAIRRPRRA